jgi:1-acyl-sn-glycerol-3-phosphate acyltransferase
VLIALNTAVAATSAMLAAYFYSQGKWVNCISRFWGKLNLMLSGVSMSISGEEYIDENQPYIVMANHQSYYDVFALIGYLPLPLKWVMKMELREIPIFGIACEKIGHIYITLKRRKRASEWRVKRYGPALPWYFFQKAQEAPMENSSV